tara:strand:- start:257 stop:466 length:210 start_codon:yes stop_codon:yes gene_type:complete
VTLGAALLGAGGGGGGGGGGEGVGAGAGAGALAVPPPPPPHEARKKMLAPSSRQASGLEDKDVTKQPLR